MAEGPTEVGKRSYYEGLRTDCYFKALVKAGTFLPRNLSTLPERIQDSFAASRRTELHGIIDNGTFRPFLSTSAP